MASDVIGPDERDGGCMRKRGRLMKRGTPWYRVEAVIIPGSALAVLLPSAAVARLLPALVRFLARHTAHQ